MAGVDIWKSETYIGVGRLHRVQLALKVDNLSARPRMFFVVQSAVTILVVLQHSSTLVDHFLNIFHATDMVLLDAIDRAL